ncbi:hypothetical protein [Burkholderia oklahomensis]|uniref:hypothetical protein n=1 Tax=Burkholderia oklahomensis TaxID=342113 RepID=UPI000A635871|nr:hypothetical protein [Burkholderia oklahomensis]
MCRLLIRIPGHPGKDYSQYPENMNVLDDLIGGKSRRGTGIFVAWPIIFTGNAIRYYGTSHRGMRQFWMTQFANNMNN